MDDGLPKMFVIHKALTLRREHPEWFGPDAAYTPIQAKGSKAQHVLAHLRGESVLTVAPFYTQTLGGDWANTTLDLPAGTWRNRLTGETVPAGTVQIAELLKRFPVALLIREEN
jgi:(1->4)-alpha-D-glucan 1-alpha-D-glucosylmutase